LMEFLVFFLSGKIKAFLQGIEFCTKTFITIKKASKKTGNFNEAGTDAKIIRLDVI
jgi:hypothetical protein